MKELSIEQKAKRYDEAIKEATIAHKDEDRHLKSTIERIFPELKESNDERIRKSLIELFKDMEWDDSILHDYNMDKDKTIAWLEKHDENTLIEEIKRRKEILLKEKENAVSYAGSISLGARIAMLEELLAFASETTKAK